MACERGLNQSLSFSRMFRSNNFRHVSGSQFKNFSASSQLVKLVVCRFPNHLAGVFRCVSQHFFVAYSQPAGSSELSTRRPVQQRPPNIASNPPLFCCRSIEWTMNSFLQDLVDDILALLIVLKNGVSIGTGKAAGLPCLRFEGQSHVNVFVRKLESINHVWGGPGICSYRHVGTAILIEFSSNLACRPVMKWRGSRPVRHGLMLLSRLKNFFSRQLSPFCPQFSSHRPNYNVGLINT